MPFYAVARGNTPGIYTDWETCEAQVRGYSGAKYKKFSSQAEALRYMVTERENSGVESLAPSVDQRFNKEADLRASKEKNENLLKDLAQIRRERDHALRNMNAMAEEISRLTEENSELQEQLTTAEQNATNN